MTQVKFNNEKWWVFHQESWVEIAEKDWENVARLAFDNSAIDSMFDYKFKEWWPTPDQIYSLPDKVKFEIKRQRKIFTDKGSKWVNTEMKFSGHEYRDIAIIRDFTAQDIDDAWKYWEEDQKTNSQAYNPHAFVYGWKCCLSHIKQVAHLKESEQKKITCAERCDWPNCTLEGCVFKNAVERSEEVKKEQIELEVNHIFESGANEIRVCELIKRLLKDSQSEIESLREKYLSFGRYLISEALLGYLDAQNIELTVDKFILINGGKLSPKEE